MSETINLNEQKKLKRRKNIFKYGFALTTVASVYGFFNHMQEKMLELNDKLANTPESFSEFNDVFSKYGCETKAEFEQFLTDNSTTYTDWIMYNGKLTQVTMVRYNEQAQVAYNDYVSANEIVTNMVNDNPMQYMDIGVADAILCGAVPTIMLAGYLVQRRNYKKACKVAEAIKAENVTSAENEALTK